MHFRAWLDCFPTRCKLIIHPPRQKGHTPDVFRQSVLQMLYTWLLIALNTVFFYSMVQTKEERELGGKMMAFAMSLGLAMGAGCSFLTVSLIWIWRRSSVFSPANHQIMYGDKNQAFSVPIQCSSVVLQVRFRSRIVSSYTLESVTFDVSSASARAFVCWWWVCRLRWWKCC